MSYSSNQDNPREDGYVECTECGRPIEQHDTESLDLGDGLRCEQRWTQAEIRRVRREQGLPGRWVSASS